MQVSYTLALFISFLASFVLVITKNWHGRFSLDSATGVQKFHTEATPRIGGVGVMAGLLAGCWLAPPDVRALLGPMLLASSLAFGFGLLEDICKTVGVLPRLLATMGSGLLAWHLTGVAMQNTGVYLLDWALQWLPLAVLFTAFAVGGVANAVNIIDGFNGLASGSVAIMAGAIGLIALDVGDPSLAGAQGARYRSVFYGTRSLYAKISKHNIN